MKNNMIKTAFFCLFLSYGINAQINLEHSFSSVKADNQLFGKIKLSTSGIKYLDRDLYNGKIYLYNEDYTPFKTLQFPATLAQSIGNYMVLYISEELFDTDPTTVEFIIRSYEFSTATSIVNVYREDGTLLFTRDNVNMAGAGDLLHGPFIFNSDNGTRMMLVDKNTTAVYIYSLPGTLLCDACSDGLTSGISVNSGYAGLSLPFPNPSTAIVTIPYQLPDEGESGVLNLYDASGLLIESMKIYSNEKEIKFDPKMFGLSAGSYLYSIEQKGKKITTQTIIIQ